MAHGDTFALGHAVEADCCALTIGGAAHAHRGAAAQGESRSGVRAVVNREIRGATCSRQGRVELGDVDRIGVVDAGCDMRQAAVEIGGIGSAPGLCVTGGVATGRSEEHTSELQSLMRLSYAVCSL